MASNAQIIAAYFVVALFVVAAVVAAFGFALFITDVAQTYLPLAVLLSGAVTAAYAVVGVVVGHFIWGD